MKLFQNLRRIKFRCHVLAQVFLWVSVFLLAGQMKVIANEEKSALETLQARAVQGIVTDDTGESLPGVNVVIKGTTNGVMTGVDGSFSITVPNDNAVLVFSFIGFISQEITVGSQRTINITMHEDTRQLEEVIVIGYGTQSREMVTSSISKVNNKILENVPYPNAASALQGAAAGVRVQSISGQPGAAPRVIIRGGTSINNPNGAAPLYIIDGVVRTQMADISSDDIESMQVLKDAAATSIYGARGSNGVVIINSKKGKAGKTKVSYKYDLTLSEIGKTYKMASARDYLTLTRTGLIADAKFPDNTTRLSMAIGSGTGNDLSNNTAFTTQYLTDANRHKLNEGWQQMPDPVDPSRTLIFTDTDFQSLTYRTGVSHNNFLEVSGGTEKATFNAGLGFMTSEGNVINTDYQRMNCNLSSTLQATDWLSFSGRVIYSDSKTHNSPFGTNVTFYRSAGLAPTAKVRFEDGTLAPGASSSIGNPLYHMYVRNIDNNNEYLTVTFDAELKILPKLTFSPQISMFSTNNTTRAFTPAYWEGPLSYTTTRSADASLYKWKQYQAEGVFNYMDTFLSDHNLSAMAGFSYYNRTERRLSAAGRGASSDKIPTLNASAEPTSVSSSITDHVMIGYFGRINYNYKYKYLLSLNARFDGASNLGNEHKWGFFPGVSVGWHVDKENFWNFLPEELLKIKLRASYGVNGNISGLGDFTAQGAYSVGSRYMGNAGVLMSTMANQNLRWERSKTSDLGMDLGLYKGRINILFDWYNRITEDLITSLALPPSTGYGSIQTNLGSLQNRGIELEINANVLPETSKTHWNLSFNISKVETKILKLPPNGIENNRVGGVYVWDAKLGDYAWKGGTQEGGRIGDLFAYKQLGIYATDAEAKNAPTDMIVTVTDRTKFGGDVIWKDLDGNGLIDDRDREYMGNPYPTWTGGFTNFLSYKGFDLFVRTDYTLGHTIYNYAWAFLDYNWQGDNNMTQEVVDRSWKQQGDKADMARHYWGGDRGQQNGIRGNSFFYQKGDFLCIREASLSYNLPSDWINRIKISGVRFTVTGNNLYYFTKYTGLNPEDGGQDDGRYAMPRNLIFSANITF